MIMKELQPIIFFVIGILILAFTFKQSVNSKKDQENSKLKDLLEQDLAASYVRKKPLPDSLYIHIDFTKCPEVSKTPELEQAYQAVMHFKELRMCHLKEMSNLQIKQLYGPATLDELIVYENTYDAFINSGYQYCHLLYTEGFLNEAQTFLEYLMENGCDLSKGYILLIDLYSKKHDTQKLTLLKETLLTKVQAAPYLKKVLKHLDESEMIK